jgi:hypothetical protein
MRLKGFLVRRIASDFAESKYLLRAIASEAITLPVSRPMRSADQRARAIADQDLKPAAAIERHHPIVIVVYLAEVIFIVSSIDVPEVNLPTATETLEAGRQSGLPIIDAHIYEWLDGRAALKPLFPREAIIADASFGRF